MVLTRRFWYGALAGLAGALALVAFSFAVMANAGVRTTAELLADGSTSFVPLALFSWTVNTFGKAAKIDLLAGIVGGQAVMLTLFAALVAPLWSRLAGLAAGAVRPLGLLAAALATAAIPLGVTVALVGGAVFSTANRAGSNASLTAMALGYLLYGVVAVLLYARLTRPSRRADAVGAEGDAGRRRALTTLGALIVGAYLGTVRFAPAEAAVAGAARTEPRRRPAGVPGWADDVPGMTPAITPTEAFYKVSKNVFDPTVDMGKWKLEVTGLVKNPLSLGYDELRAMPGREQFASLECIDNRVGGDLIGHAAWKGVPLAELLRQAEPQAGAVKVVFHGWDDYTDSVTLDRAMADANLLAYDMNGAPLNQDHGYPLRLLVPGIYGMKNVKWIHKIELVANDYQGFWQQRGWSDDATVQTMSRIDLPTKDVAAADAKWIGGVAFSGNRGISRVEISRDGGATWRDARLKDAFSPNSWRLWVDEWNGEPGEYTLVVRATDGDGTPQTAETRDTLPSGATGLHRVKLRVR